MFQKYSGNTASPLPVVSAVARQWIEGEETGEVPGEDGGGEREVKGVVGDMVVVAVGEVQLMISSIIPGLPQTMDTKWDLQSLRDGQGCTKTTWNWR